MPTNCHIAVYESTHDHFEDFVLLTYLSDDGQPGGEHGVFPALGPHMQRFLAYTGYNVDAFCARLVQHLCNSTAPVTTCGVEICRDWRRTVGYMYRINLDTLDMICYGGNGVAVDTLDMRHDLDSVAEIARVNLRTSTTFDFERLAPRELSAACAVRKLTALAGSDPARDHALAEEILLAAVSTMENGEQVAEAFRALQGRAIGWGYA